MKTSRTNSFRLHRINKTGSLRKASQTFYDPDESFKLAALNSVSRGVKHADLSLLTGSDLNKLRVQPLESNEGQFNSAHHNLTEVRKRYDEMKKERVAIEEKLDKQKEEIGKLSIFKSEYEEKIGQAKSRANQLKEELEAKKSLLQETVTEKKGRHKIDRVFYDQRKFDMDKELSYLKKQLNIFKKQGHQILESEDRTSKIYEKLSKQLQREKQEREEHIKNLQNMIQEKLQLLNTNQYREAELVEIAERAIQDKDLNEKHWRKIFLTHAFVNRMLRNKIEREMQKFKIVQFAFKEIKTATGVSDAKSLVNKYLNKQAVYGQLLGKIADNQKTIEQLKNQTQQLIQQSKSLEMEREVLHSIKVKSLDLHDPLKQFEQLDEKDTRAKAFQNKMRQWTVRQLKKFGHIEKNQEMELSKNPEKVVEAINKYLALMKTESNLQIQEISQDKQTGGLPAKQNEKITRVQPKRARLNSSGQEIFDVDEEQLQPQTQNEELDLINNQWEELIRNNDKFMKEVKKKKLEEIKLQLEKRESKKAVPKAPEPKKDD